MIMTKNFDARDIDKLRYCDDPVQGKKARQIRGKLLDVYMAIKANGYFITNDILEIQPDATSPPKKVFHVPSALIVAHLINKSSSLLEGPPGCGKTKIVKIVSRLMTGSSINLSDNIIYCDNSLEKEKWLGDVDLGKLMKDHERQITWAKWLADPEIIDFIFDEINRAPKEIQHELLSLLSEGWVQWSVSEKKLVKEFRIFFTQNPFDDIMKSDGVNSLEFAFMDRIAQYIPVSQPPVEAMEVMSDIRVDERNYGYDEDNTIKPVMSIEYIREASVLSSVVPVTMNGKRYAQYLMRDSSLCLRADLFDKSHVKEPYKPGEPSFCKGCHFSGNTKYHCSKYFGGSMRSYKDLIAVARAYAFFLEIKEVTEYLIQSIALDVIAHRVHVLPVNLREDSSHGMSKRSFLKAYLVDWCFSQLSNRADAEESFNNLYNGNGTRTDLQKLIANAQHDLYIRIDRLPKIMDIPKNLLSGNLRENDITRYPSAVDEGYKEIATSINEVMESDDDPEKKWDQLLDIEKSISRETVLYGNLLHMIHTSFPKLQELIKRKNFLRGTNK
jgi:MoxR-like ATPase